jgi:nucleobindin
LEHFSHHEKIEQEEIERLAKFQGISLEEVLKYQVKSAESQDAAQSPLAVRLLWLGRRKDLTMV